MPIDTSSYYPEVNGPDEKDKNSLNGRHSSLFGDPKPIDKPEKREIEAPAAEVAVAKTNKKASNSSEKVTEIFCSILSWLLVPMLMPVYGIIFIFKLSVLDMVAPGMQNAFTFIIAGINFFIPALVIILLKNLGVIQDIALNGRKERLIPYMVSIICLGTSAWFLGSRGAPVWMCMFFTGGAVAGLVNLIINFKWKISAHSAGIAGIIALLIRLEKDMNVEPQLFIWLLITIGAAGLLGSARIWLQRHTLWQVIAGYAVGFLSVFFMMAIH